jgi:predicted DNA-binding transcriptional regulator YafY
MRASRLVSLLLLLQTRGQLTAGELARELEVSVRTVYRDVEALSEAGVPIYAERGPYGGIRLVEGYRTRLTGLTVDEAEGLFLSGLPGPAAELGLGTVVAAARLKVLAAMPPELRSRAARISERFHLDAPGWFRSSDETPHLQALSTAVWEDRRALVEYDRGDHTTERLLEPLGLVLKGGVWYIVASSEGQTRTYRVSRMRDVTLTEERFSRPERFDLAAYWSDATTAFEAAVERVDVTLRIDPDRLEALASVFGESTLQAAEQLDTPDPEGWVHLRLRLDWPNEVHRRLLPLGATIEVLDPPEVRDRLITTAERILVRYGTRPRAMALV